MVELQEPLILRLSAGGENKEGVEVAEIEGAPVESGAQVQAGPSEQEQRLAVQKINKELVNGIVELAEEFIPKNGRRDKQEERLVNMAEEERKKLGVRRYEYVTGHKKVAPLLSSDVQYLRDPETGEKIVLATAMWALGNHGSGRLLREKMIKALKVGPIPGDVLKYDRKSEGKHWYV